MTEMSCGAAAIYLLERLNTMVGKDSRHTPHWNERDQEAVRRLLDRPATQEQIALARIEGITHGSPTLYSSTVDHIHGLARRALGLRTTQPA